MNEWMNGHPWYHKSTFGFFFFLIVTNPLLIHWPSGFGEEQFCSPQNTWQCLETFFIVMTRGEGHYWPWWVEAREASRPPTVPSLSPNLSAALRNATLPWHLLHSALGLRRLVWNATHQLPIFTSDEMQPVGSAGQDQSYQDRDHLLSSLTPCLPGRKSHGRPRSPLPQLWLSPGSDNCPHPLVPIVLGMVSAPPIDSLHHPLLVTLILLTPWSLTPSLHAPQFLYLPASSVSQGTLTETPTRGRRHVERWLNTFASGWRCFHVTGVATRVLTT